MAESPADRHRRIAAGFTDRVVRVRDWDAPTPVPEWRVRDVIDHLISWSTGFLADSGVVLPAPEPGERPAGPATATEHGPATEAGPATGWLAHAAAIQRLFDEPASAGQSLAHPRFAGQPLDQVLNMIYTTDIFLHTWDLARGAGLDDRLDPAECAALLAGMTRMAQLIRSSGQYGPEVPVPPEADPQAKLIGFIGRDPDWKPSPAAPPVHRE